MLFSQVKNRVMNKNDKVVSLKSEFKARYQWLTPMILATWEAEIERITIQG
jgi:hypothetical protein